MLDHDRLPPIVPVDVTLALHIIARRAAAGARHLLPSAPLSGRSVRRLTRGSAAGSSAAALTWRAQRGWLSSGTSRPAAPPVAAIQAGAVTPPLNVEHVAPNRADTTGMRDLSAERQHDEVVAPVFQRPDRVAEAADTARGLTVAPSLVWFARWREMRLMRVLEERRSAPLAGDMLRPIVRVRPLPDAPNPGAGQALPSTRASVAPSSSIVQRTEWAPLAAVLRSRLAMPQAEDGLHARERGAARSRPFGVADAPLSSERSIDSPSAVIPLVPSVGVATRAAAQAATQASAQATARAMQAVNEALPKRVAAQVRHDVAQAVERIAASRSPSSPDAAALVDDRVVHVLLGRMRALLREEQFRHGQIR